MTLASFNARLRRCDKRYHLRKRTGWVTVGDSGFAMCGLFNGYKYMKIATLTGDMPYHTRPTVWRVERLPGQARGHKHIHLRMRRGRYEIVKMLTAQRRLHRWQRQFLIL